MSDEALDALRARVHSDGTLARRLRGAEPARFAADVAHVAAQLGLEVTEDDVRERERIAEYQWKLRWIR